MKKTLMLIMALALAVPMCLYAYDPEDYKYELEYAPGSSSSTAGYVMVKVWSYGPRERLTRNRCMANAVHGILFKGLDAPQVGAAGKISALVPGGYESNPDYFDKFFNDAYLQYVQASSKGAYSAGDRVKVTRREYKIGMTVKVNVNALRQRLEKDGIASGPRSLFMK